MQLNRWLVEYEINVFRATVVNASSNKGELRYVSQPEQVRCILVTEVRIPMYTGSNI